MEDVDDDIRDLLSSIDRISLGELSPPSTYDFIRYSTNPLLDTQADFPLLNNERSDQIQENKTFALNFSGPPEEFRDHVEYLIDNSGDVGTDIEEWYRSSAESLAETALEAGTVGKKLKAAQVMF